MKAIIALLVIALFVTACVVKPTRCPDGSFVKKAEDCPMVQQAQEQLDELERQMENLPTDFSDLPSDDAGTDDSDDSTGDQDAAPSSMDPVIGDLLDKAGTVQSMQFVHAPIEVTSTGIVTLARDTYSVRGDLVKVETILPPKYDRETHVDTIYLNLATKTVKAYCLSDRSSICSTPGEERTAKFSDYDIEYPLDWVDRIPNSAFIKETRQHESREVKVVQFEMDGSYYEVYLDPFMGVPMHVAYYADEARTDLEGGVEYHDIAYNFVKDADVTAP